MVGETGSGKTTQYARISTFSVQLMTDILLTQDPSICCLL